VSFKTAEHARKVAKELGYRSELFEREVPDQRTKILAMIVADINNPVFHGMVRGAERTATHHGYTVLVVETQESGAAEQSAVQRVLSSVDGIILTSSRMSDSAIPRIRQTTAVGRNEPRGGSGRLSGKRQCRSYQASRRAPSQLWCWSHHLPCRAASLLG
jgi:DNA-binding LacI/PurR family transcriptional regulator